MYIYIYKSYFKRLLLECVKFGKPYIFMSIPTIKYYRT